MRSHRCLLRVDDDAGCMDSVAVHINACRGCQTIAMDDILYTQVGQIHVAGGGASDNRPRIHSSNSDKRKGSSTHNNHPYIRVCT